MGRKQKLRQERKAAAVAATADKINTRGSLFWIILIGFCALMLYPPFFRGLFFTRELLPTHAYSALLFGLWWMYRFSVKKDTKFLKYPLDHAVLAISIAYAISLIPAVNTRTALGELLKNINYFFAFYMAAEITRELKKPQFLLNVLLINITLVALLGLGAAAGTFDYPGAFSGGRIYSSLQYPNTLATYLTAGFFLSMTLLLECENRWGRFLYPAVNFTLFFVFIFTYSRGAWLAFPLVLILYLIGLARAKRPGAVILFVLMLIPVFLCMQGFNSSISIGAQSKAWLWYISGALLTVCLSQLNYIAAKYISGANKKRAAYAAATVFVVLAILAGVVLSAREPIILAHSDEEEDSWKTVRREVGGIEPNTDYELALDIEAENLEEKQYSWRIVIQSINDRDEATSIMTETGENTDGKEAIVLPFSTVQDTDRLRINFYNRYTNTYALYDNINILNTKGQSEPIPVTTSFKYIPENLVERLGSINLKQSSAGGRLEFYGDALKIIKDYPIFGAGGGGWESLYRAYQSRLYWTTEVHSFPLQLWIETGTLGFIVLCAVGITFAYNVFKLLINKAVDNRIKNYVWAAFIGAFALGAHSAIDFNLSLGAVALLLWSLVGIAHGGMTCDEEKGEVDKRPKGARDSIGAGEYALAILPAGFVMILSLSLFVGEMAAVKAGGYLEEGFLTEAVDAFDRATRFDPFESQYRAEKAQLLEFIAHHTEDASYLQKAGVEYKKALKHDGHSAKINSVAGFYYLTIGQAEKGFEHIEKAIKFNPYLIDYYEEKAYAYKSLVEYMIENNNPDDAIEYIESTLGIADDIASLNRGNTKPIKTSLRLITDLEKLAFMGNEADNRRIPRYANRIVFAATQMISTIDDNVPDLWKTGNSSGGDISVRIENEDDGTRILRLENAGDGRGYIYTENFALRPDDWYLLTFKARGDIKPSNFRVHVLSRSGEKSTQGSISSVKVTGEWQEFELELLTHKDIEPGGQYIRIDHQGKDDGYFEIKDIVLKEW